MGAGAVRLCEARTCLCVAAVRACAWLSAPVRGSARLCVAVRAYMYLSAAVRACTWLSAPVPSYMCLYVAVRDCALICASVHNFDH